MADPFLLAHLVHPLFFDLGGRLIPVSIRDQMVRARMAVDRAIEEGLIGHGRPLLAIGAGAAGATAAMHAAARGVASLLIEAAAAPFLRQAGCRTRWIDPVQYDWPVGHWQKKIYPWKPPSMPLPWQNGPANGVALAWTLALARAHHLSPNLDVRFRTMIIGRPRLLASNKLRVFLGGSGRFLVVDVGMVLSCVGAGREASSHDRYTGYDFWATDPFQRLPSDARVLISGGGDGALQDYLRVVTGMRAAGEIYSRCHIPLGHEQTLASAEDQANRVFTWGTGGRHDHGALEELHDVHADIVNKLLPGPGAHPPIQALLAELAEITRSTPTKVTMLHPCTHFSRCYGLNRFLVLLLATYLARYRNLKTLLGQRKLADISPVGHQCANQAAACHGKEHEIFVAPDLDCRVPASAPQPQGVRRLPDTYTVVIVRHGIQANPPLVAGNRQLPQPRQVLPYHVGR